MTVCKVSRRCRLEVLRLVAEGRTSAEIATELFVSTWTAERYIKNIYTKIGVSKIGPQLLVGPSLTAVAPG